MVKYPRTRVHDEPLLALGLKKKVYLSHLKRVAVVRASQIYVLWDSVNPRENASQETKT